MPNDNVRKRRRSSVAVEKLHEAWVDRELADCDFVDERLGKRFRSLLEQLSSSPGDSIPLVCQYWANTKAAYRFFDNERVGEAEILGGHFQATRDRASATSGPILVMHDTTEFTYKREDVDAVGKTRVNFNRAYRDGKPRLYTACASPNSHASAAI
jgi:Transposase DNA-binding